MNPLNILIVDDESLARKRIAELVSQACPEGIIKTAASLSEAKHAIDVNTFSLIFLDINLKGELGFDLVPFIPKKTKIVFITALDKYAIRAFEVNALDYILKPPTLERIQKSVNQLNENGLEPVDLKEFSLDDRIFVQSNDAIRFINLTDIKYIQAKDVYSMIITSEKKSILVRKSLMDWIKILPHNHFIRIHRSSIVNIKFIQHIAPYGKGTDKVYLDGVEEPLSMSKAYAGELKKRLIK